MDTPDIRSSTRPGTAWTPLGDAVARVVQPLCARLAAALDGGAPQAGPQPRDPVELPPRVVAEAEGPAAADAPPQPGAACAAVQAIDGRDHLKVIDPAAFYAELDRTAQDEPATVAEARAMIADPQAALAESELERQIAWLVAGADLRQRRAGAARTGGIVA